MSKSQAYNDIINTSRKSNRTVDIKLGMQSIIEVGNITITKKGREYLKDNSLMRKVSEMLGEGFTNNFRQCYRYVIKHFNSKC